MEQHLRPHPTAESYEDWRKRWKEDPKHELLISLGSIVGLVKAFLTIGNKGLIAEVNGAALIEPSDRCNISNVIGTGPVKIDSSNYKPLHKKMTNFGVRQNELVLQPETDFVLAENAFEQMRQQALALVEVLIDEIATHIQSLMNDPYDQNKPFETYLETLKEIRTKTENVTPDQISGNFLQDITS